MLLLPLSGPAPNPCEANGGRGPCSHLCLINYNRTVSCACPHLMKLHKDNTTCYGRKPSPPLTVTGKLRLKERSLLLSKGMTGRRGSENLLALEERATTAKI